MALKDWIAGGIGALVEKGAEAADRFIQTKDEKAAFKLELEKIAQQAASELEQTMRQELQAKERIMVAELTQGDTYTKRARPTVVYFGLGVIAFNFCLIPVVGYFATGTEMPQLPLPAEFWYAWGGIVATWSVGRTMERRGAGNNLVNIITGSPKKPSLTGD